GWGGGACCEVRGGLRVSTRRSSWGRRWEVCGVWRGPRCIRWDSIPERRRAGTGGMRRTHLRGHQNILKRLLIHVGAFNLSLIFRVLLGSGTPRELRNRPFSLVTVLFWLLGCSSAPMRRI